MRNKLLTILYVTVNIFYNTAIAGDAVAGKEKASVCVRCHGVNGVTENTNIPNLAGQNEGYLIKQLTDYRDGLRRSTVMRQVARKLTDQDIEDLAAYYHSLQHTQTR